MPLSTIYAITLCLFLIYLVVTLNLDLVRLRLDLDKERVAHTVTRERLLAAHKDGYVIPPPPSPVEDEPDLSLPDELSPIWEQWDGPGREPQKRVLRDMIAQGRTVQSILDEFGVLPNE